MPKTNIYVTQAHFDKTMNGVMEKLNKLVTIEEKQDWLIGKYKSHEVVEDKLGIVN